MKETEKINEESLEDVVGGTNIPSDYSINYVTYRQAKSFIPKLYQSDGVEAAIQFGKDHIVNSNLWDEMRDFGPEHAVDRVYGFYYSFY